ncbi:flavin-containing monooxygenase [Mycolicibacterium sp.]|uniref:flavin-containing monooxygenase n=1 Tax=Mycolicibacterium sp. TaxID=2320850 RepID=UPI003560AD26
MTTIEHDSQVDTGGNTEQFDVVIIGAGISGLGAAYRLVERNPGARYVILERRDQIGGTWDLFRYPGVRSDSSIFTLSFPYEPWTHRDGVADGADIRNYLIDFAAKHRIDSHIRFGSYVRSADWDSTTDTWTVQVDQGGATKSFQARFLFFGSGYYNYDEPYVPEFPGIDKYEGVVANPQHWPEDLDYTDKRVVVIGSGATAVTLVPALAERAAKVVMLQRSPTYVFPGKRVNGIVQFVRNFAPRKFSHWFARWFAALFEGVVWFLSRKFPAMMRGFIRRRATANLPSGYPVDVHFKPRYNPWDQRLCLDADGDLFNAVSAGKVEIITDHIDRFDATGIWLKSGQHLTADIVATATGLQLQALGGVRISLDGNEIKPQDRYAYKAHMLEDVPNLAWCLGYTNASWTLRADMTAEQFAKLVAFMDAHGYTHAYPHLGDEPMPEKLSWDINAGYVQRAPHALPKSGTKRPWNVRQNFFADAVDHRFDRIEESMIFGRVAHRSPLSA